MRLVLAAVAFLAVPPAQPDVTIPSDAAKLYTAEGRGVQAYHCAAVAGVFAWGPAAPEAVLLEPASGRQLGTHSAGPIWTWSDGSAVRGKVVQKRPSPDPASIPWLLLSAEPAAAATGALTHVAWVRRSETHGGVAPASGCDAAHPDATARVPYTATYTFYAATPSPGGASH